ncbi:MAG: hypothetical protein ACLVAH_07790 [Anaeromassilibacillus sp.]
MSRKKQVLFINYSLHSGGIEKSLVTLLSLFDFAKYEVDLQLFANEGLFLERVPSQVHLLPPLFPAEYKLNIRQALTALLRKGHPLVAICRLFDLRGKTPEEWETVWCACGRLRSTLYIPLRRNTMQLLPLWRGSRSIMPLQK